jgi:hypothetical protein
MQRKLNQLAFTESIELLLQSRDMAFDGLD